MSHYEYLLVLLGCVLVTLPLEFVFRARVYRRPVALILTLALTVVVFSVWDVVAIARGHWWYSARYVTGIDLPFGLPLEEVLFFVVIPLCALLSYEAVGRVQWELTRRVGRSGGAADGAAGDRDA